MFLNKLSLVRIQQGRPVHQYHQETALHAVRVQQREPQEMNHHMISEANLSNCFCCPGLQERESRN